MTVTTVLFDGTMSKPVQILVGTAAAAFLIIVAVVISAFLIGHHQSQDQQSKRTPICTEVFKLANQTITDEAAGNRQVYLTETQEFFALTRQRANEVSQSDPAFSAALQQMNLTADGLHALDAYC